MTRTEFVELLLGLGFEEKTIYYGEFFETHYIKTRKEDGWSVQYQFEVNGSWSKFAMVNTDDNGIIRDSQFIPCFYLESLKPSDIARYEDNGDIWCRLEVYSSSGIDEKIWILEG